MSLATASVNWDTVPHSVLKVQSNGGNPGWTKETATIVDINVDN